MAVDDKYTVSLLHFDGGITDESGKVWTAVNNATTSTTQSKFGDNSLYLNGTNQYLTTPNSSDFDFGSGDFTIDWWEYRTSDQSGSVFQIFGKGYSTIEVGYFGNLVYMSSSNSGFDIANAKTLGPQIYNAWTHYAVVRSGNTFYNFQNGIQQATWTSALALSSNTDNTRIGYDSGVVAPSPYFNGYLDEFRVSKGVARWTSNFTPPTEPYSPGAPLSAPTNLTATAGDSQVSLSWTAVTGATGYNVKRSTTTGGPYTTIASNVSGTSYVDTAVTNGTTYYYVVTAVNADGESANSNEASATPQAQGGHSLLRITMNDSSEREYRVTDSEVDSFVKWYDRTVNTGNTCYSFNDSVDGSKEYLAFEKIISFKVMPLTK